MNRENLATKKSPELFRLAVSFKNTVCCNMCVFTDGYKDDIKVMGTKELFKVHWNCLIISMQPKIST